MNKAKECQSDAWSVILKQDADTLSMVDSTDCLYISQSRLLALKEWTYLSKYMTYIQYLQLRATFLMFFLRDAICNYNLI